jgi:hypothetical protein
MFPVDTSRPLEGRSTLISAPTKTEQNPPMDGPQPSRSSARPRRIAALALALLVGVGLLVEFSSNPTPQHVRDALRPGLSIQEGILAIPAEHRRFTLQLRSLPAGEFKTSALALEGESAVVTARDPLSRSGRVDVHQALAQLSGEIATVDTSISGWEIQIALDADTKLPLDVQLSRGGAIRAR